MNQVKLVDEDCIGENYSSQVWIEQNRW